MAEGGLVPVFCDINEDDYTLDVSKIEELLGEKTSAILPVHVYGHLCDTSAIEQIAQRHGLKVIYDAAHAFGVTRSGLSSACFGDISIFSFHATKVFYTIEGGRYAIGRMAWCPRRTTRRTSAFAARRFNVGVTKKPLC